MRWVSFVVVLLVLALPGVATAATDWTEADKDGYGTSTTTTSKVWHTLDDGRLTEVFYPDLGTPSVRTLEFVVCIDLAAPKPAQPLEGTGESSARLSLPEAPQAPSLTPSPTTRLCRRITRRICSGSGARIPGRFAGADLPSSGVPSASPLSRMVRLEAAPSPTTAESSVSANVGRS